MNRTKKILIIEDEDLIAMALRYTLAELGYEVTDCLRSGEEALGSIESNFPDVILMDIKIEGEMDGIDTASLIQKKYNIPIIFLTSYSNTETLERAKKTNPFGYIIKPYQERELYTTIELTYHKHRHETQLLESERKYRELTESIQHIVIELDNEGRILYINQAGMSLLGIIQLDSAEGVYLHRVMSGKDFKKLFSVLSSGKVNAESGNDITLTSLTGKIVYAKHYLTPVLVHTKITGYRGVIMDVSSDIIKNRLYQLYETITQKYNISTFIFTQLIDFVISELGDVFPHVDDIFFCYPDKGNKVVSIRKNRRSSRHVPDIFIQSVLEQKRALHFKGSKLAEFIKHHPPVSDEEEARCWAGFPFNAEGMPEGLFGLRSNSDPNCINCSDFPVLAGFIHSLESFIEKNLLAAKVKASNDRYSQLIEFINEGVVQIDKAGKILFVNNRFCEMVGAGQDELLGHYALDMLNDFPEKREFMLEQLTSRNLGESTQYEFQLPTKKFGMKHFIINASPLHDDMHRHIGSISTWIDITENKTLSSMLSESEQKFREIADNISGAFWVIEWKSKTMQFVNPAFYEIFEMQSELSQTAIFSEWTTLVNEGIDHPLISAASPATLYDIQYKIRTVSGKIKWIHEKATCIYNKKGELDRIVGYSTDITIRKSAEESLGKNEKEKEAILSQLLDTIIVIGNNGDISNAYIKKNEEILFQFTAREVTGKNISDVFPQSITEMLYSFISISAVNQNSHVFEYEYKNDLERKWFELRIVRGTTRNLIVIIRNITNEKHYFIEMRKFYNIISQTNELIMITDNTGKIEFINDTFTRVTNYEMSEILGRQPRFLNSGKHKRKFYIEMWKTILAGKSFSAEFINRKKNGELYYEEKIITPLINEKGDITKFISTGRDITEKKKAEKELLAYAKLEKIQEKRTEKLRTTALIQGQELERMRLAREIHDGLGQILTAAKFNIEHFRKRDFNNVRSEALFRAIKRLVNNSIKETRKISDNLSPVGLSDYGLESVVQKMIGEISSGKSIVINFTSNLKRSRFEPNAEINLFRIIQESINNALKHSRATRINVVIHHKEDKLRVRIKDNGIGIRDEVVKSDRNKSYGLRNIRERAKIINADCFIKSKDLKGTEIDVQLKISKLKI